MGKIPLKALIVSVDYGDLLSITLPANAGHFEKILVVTAPHDRETIDVVSRVPNAVPYVTDAFYRRGANFNKGLAVEEGLDVLGRDGWIVIRDADIIVPDQMPLDDIRPGNLYCPYRRMVTDPASYRPGMDWSSIPVHGDGEFAGYFQLFNAGDPVLVSRPWYGVDWRHAGGCDSVFWMKWKSENRIRTAFTVLHLGEDGRNWCGRVTGRLDGTVPPLARERESALREIIAARGRGGVRYAKDKII